MAYTVRRLDHVQLAMPVGGETEAETFYSGVLGLRPVPKPAPLADRGGRWFTGEGVTLHLGAEADFRPARKAHPALVVSGLDELVARIEAEGGTVRWDAELPDVRRCFVDDPFGNRLELIAVS